MSAQDTRSRDRSLSEDAIFSLLSNQRRRYVIYYLERTQGEVRLRDLAERIAAWENGVDVAELDYKQRKRVYTSLHQTHLPKLDDVGVLDYDRDRGTITAAERAADLDAYLSVVDGETRWSDRYLGLSVLCLASLVVAWADVVPLPDLALAGVIVTAFAVTAGVHRRRSRRTVVGDDPDVE